MADFKMLLLLNEEGEVLNRSAINADKVSNVRPEDVKKDIYSFWMDGIEEPLFTNLRGAERLTGCAWPVLKAPKLDTPPPNEDSK